MGSKRARKYILPMSNVCMKSVIYSDLAARDSPLTDFMLEDKSLTQFESVIAALIAGQSVRRSVWEPITSMFIKDGEMVCQRGKGQPYSYDLSWYEIVACDWEIAEARAA
jgi:hypothetical protein